MNKKLLPIFFLALMLPLGLWSQNITVTGKVVSSDDGFGLPGVTVTIKGEAAGTVTDIDGNYSIGVDSKGTLVFSFVGFTTQEIKVNGRNKINVTMDQDAQMLDDVVVTALGIKRQKRELGYATEEIGGDLIAKSGSGSVISALSGRSAGVQIISELIKGLASMVPTLVAEAPKMIMAFIQGILDLREKLRQTGDEIIDHIKNAISEKIKDAVNWGKDLVSNFISGLKSKWGDLKSSASNLGSIIKSHLGFSEPEEGPLSNFHTYAPDMIDLFVQGIKDNAGKLTSAVDSIAGDVYDAMPTFATEGGYGTMSAGGYARSDESGDLVTAITDALMNMQLSVNIGNRPIEAMITDAQQKTNYRSGGR